MFDNSQNSFVGNGQIKLYTQEDKVKAQIDKIMKRYKNDFNNKDFIKKSIELFHLLTYLDINEDYDQIKSISPHEPGDFIVGLESKNILIEIVTVFGDVEAKEMNDNIKELLGVIDSCLEKPTNLPMMDEDKLQIQFKKVLADKQNKSYFQEYEQTMLLLVTSEHDRCGTVPWYLVGNMEKVINEFIDKTQSTVNVINYFSSGKDGNPSTGKIINEIKLYNDIFN